MSNKEKEQVFIDGMAVPIADEQNLLDLCRKANIDIPTFCYHSHLSVYGACRLCLVEVEGRGIVASCSTAPEPGMEVKTSNEEIREMRRVALELLLANHDQSCPTCAKSDSCKLQDLARRMGVDDVRFKRTHEPEPVDHSSPSLVRDPNKCVLCGDCVRACYELQDVGAIDFAYRGAQSAVLPAFGKDMAEVECVHCGQCASVCPTGALHPAHEIRPTWEAIDDPNKVVVAQIAPAVRVSLGEEFGREAGTITTGQIVSALKRIGFDHVYDTCFAADLTVLEEAHEFIERKMKGENLPQFTSCCPAWVKFAEQYYPELLPNLSSCRSPQQMFGAVARELLPDQLDVAPENLEVVSVMPCTAKKFEAGRPEFSNNGRRDVDHVLTTRELALMIQERGLSFDRIEPGSLDMPFGFKTGGGLIFGATGGVTEAVLRCATQKITGTARDVEFYEVRGEEGLREATVDADGTELKLAIVHGLSNARRIAEQALEGDCDYDLVEVMACPGGCVGGAGQPITRDVSERIKRAEGLYDTDRTLQYHKSQDNPEIEQLYKEHLGEIGGKKAHRLLHTSYQSRRRMNETDISLLDGDGEDRLPVKVCVGTGCFMRGSQDLLEALMELIENRELSDCVDVQATFCFENCDCGPNVRVGERRIEGAGFGDVVDALEEHLETSVNQSS